MLTGLLGLAFVGGGCSMTLALDGPKNQAVDGQRTAVAHQESAVAVLRRMLEHEDSDVQIAAVRELRELGPAATDAVPDLRELTEERDRVMRYEAARALVAIAPQDPVAAPTLVMISKDPQSSPEQRTEASALLQRMGRGAEAVEPVASSGGELRATTRPAGVNRDWRGESGPLKVTDVQEKRGVDAEEPRPRSVTIDPTTRPTRDTQVRPAERIDREPLERPAAPATRPSGPPKDDPVLQIPGLWRSTDPAGAQPPRPDINEHGIESYTATRALLVKDWIDRQPGTAEQKKSRWEEFVRWRSEQDRQIYARVVNK